MPAEVERLRRRLRRRDRAFLWLVAVALAGSLGAALALGHHGGTARDAGCVVYSHPNFTGAATYRYCGARAAAFCRRAAARHPALVARCEQLGLP